MKHSIFKILFLFLFFLTFCASEKSKLKEMENIYNGFKLGNLFVISMTLENYVEINQQKIKINNLSKAQSNIFQLMKYYNFSTVVIKNDIMLIVENSFIDDYTGLLYISKNNAKIPNLIHSYSIRTFMKLEGHESWYKVSGSF